MPNLDNFLNGSKQIKPEDNPNLIKLGGIRSCGKCDKDVIGAIWNEDTRVMMWTCHECNYENVFQVD
mgnify:CR=1 FL=1